MANVSKLIFGLQLQRRASQLQHWLPIRASQFLRIRMDMSHEAAKEVASTIYMIQERSRLNASRETRRHRARSIMYQVPVLADNENLA